MREQAPLVTVVIPCFEQARFLASAVDSVRRQGYPRLQVVVVNDGSTDDTAAVARRLGVELVEQRNRGLSEARNAGLTVAGGEFVIFLDADDELVGGAIARGVSAFAARPETWCVVGRCTVIDVTGRPIGVPQAPVDPGDLYATWLSRNFVWAPAAAMFRREALASLGGFPRRLGPAADYAVYLAMARRGRVHYEPRIVARYRQHPASMSRNPARMLRATLAVLRREARVAPRAYAAAVQSGRRAWRDWYGEQIVEQLRHGWRTRRLRREYLGAAWTLVRHCPRVCVRHFRRKTALGWRRLRSADLHGAR